MRMPIEAEELLASTRWVRRLAGHLVRDDAADDLAQETWVAAVGAPRPAEVALPTWLAGILRNLRRMRARSEGRRSAHEQAAATDAALAPTPESPEAALERVELDQLLGKLVLALDEPYRSTIVLRYYEGLTASEIARRTDVPAGTVRWRLKEGLDRLRADLDARWGRREAWIAVLVPLRPRDATPMPRPFLAKLAASTLGLAAIGAVLWLVRPPVRVAHDQAPRELPATPALPPRPSPAVAALARSSPPAVLSPRRFTTDPPARVQVPLGAAPMAGPADAKVTILLLGEYECAFCAKLHATLEQLRALHPQDVRVQLVQAPLAMHRNAVPAARAVYAAGEQGKYFEMDRLLFANPDDVVKDPRVDRLLASSERVVRDTEGVMRRPRLETADLEARARSLGLDLDRFRTDLAGSAVDQRMAIDKATVESAGEITAVPVLFINGRRLNGSRPLELLEKIVVEEIAIADELVARGAASANLYNELLASAPPEPKTIELSPAQLAPLTGVYQAPGGPKIYIRPESKRLAFEVHGGMTLELWPISESALIVKGAPAAALAGPARVTMARGSNGRITGAEIQHTDGSVVHAARIDDYPPARPAARIPVPDPRSAAASDDDFESGSLSAWRLDNAGAGSWFVYSNGKKPPDPRQSDPRAAFDVPEPPGGRFAAVTDMKGPGTRILYRDVTLDGRYRLHLTAYYVSAVPLAAPDTLDHEIGAPNRQFRIDLIPLGAPIDSVAPANVLAQIFTTASGPRRLEPTPVTFDLSPWQGQTVRLRLAVTDNGGPLRAAVDDVRFEKLEAP
jgi:RNA polymerase sigma factor (sigma-70 family)